MRIRRIVSGGQTGVDRAALDCAIMLGIPHGGWCPDGRIAEDGVIASGYRLTEVSGGHAQRTEANVRDSHATLILCTDGLDGGTRLTAELAARYCKPLQIAQLEPQPQPQPQPQAPGLAMVRDWLDSEEIRILNIAGPRESERPGIYDLAKNYLRALLIDLPDDSRVESDPASGA